MWRSALLVILFTRENRKYWILPGEWTNFVENMGRLKTMELIVAKCKRLICIVFEACTNGNQPVEVD